MGGQIGVQSTPGEGSTFWFTLPLNATVSADTAPDTATATRWRVLLVGDDAQTRFALGPMLARAQVDVALQAPDAATLVAHLQQQPHLAATVDAMVVDWSGASDTFDAHWLLALKAMAQLPPGTPVLHLSPPDLRPRLHELLTGQPQACLLAQPVLAPTLHKALQRVCQPSPPPVRLSPAAHQPWQHTEALKGVMVLLVEDNPLNQMVAQAFLEQAGMVVTTLDNGEKAVQEMKRVGAAHYALILMDMHMPVMDGLEATRRIRGLAGCEQIPVIAMTAAVLPADKALCRDAGMDDFVTKPVLPEALMATLLRWVPPSAAGTS
jgi:CheY-like chemotaxis protein